MYSIDSACLLQFLQSLDLVDSLTASLVLRVCKDTCKTRFAVPTHPPWGRSMTVIPGVWAGHLCLSLQKKTCLLGADPSLCIA